MAILEVARLGAIGEEAGDRYMFALRNLPGAGGRQAWVNANLLKSWWGLAAGRPELVRETYAEFEQVVESFVDPSGPGEKWDNRRKGREWDNRRKGLCQ